MIKKTKIPVKRRVRVPVPNSSKLKLPQTPPVLPMKQEDTQNLKTSDEIFIVAGGPSVSSFDLTRLKDKCTLAINKSVLFVPEPNYFITVDYTFLKKIDRVAFDKLDCAKFFVADFSFPFIVMVDGHPVDTRWNLIYDLHEFDYLIKAKNQKGFGYTIEDFRTGINSGYCALQLAIILGFKTIYLLGFDLKNIG